jgi:hypothetical protein
VVEPERKQSSLGIDKDTLSKLRTISLKSGIPQSEIVTQYIEALSKLISDGGPSTEKISLTPFEVDLVHGTLKQGFANIFSLSELPSEIQKDVLKAFDYERTPQGFRDLREHPKKESEKA